MDDEDDSPGRASDRKGDARDKAVSADRTGKRPRDEVESIVIHRSFDDNNDSGITVETSTPSNKKARLDPEVSTALDRLNSKLKQKIVPPYRLFYLAPRTRAE
jgi:hypothetical protein